MISLSAIAKSEKNKLSTDSVFLILLDISLADDTIRICYNTEDIIWNGNLYQAFPFNIGNVSETTDGSDPNISLDIDNTTRALQSIIEEANGANGYPVTLRIVNSKNLNSNKAELEEYFVIQKTDIDESYIRFTLGCEYSSRTRRPLNRYMKNNCPFQYKGLRCGYNGSIANCNHSLADCRKHNNSSRFGGFVGIDQKGVYVND